MAASSRAKALRAKFKRKNAIELDVCNKGSNSENDKASDSD